MATAISPSRLIARRAELPWWVVGVAVGAGLFLLLLIVFALYKLKFFRRKTQEDYQSMTHKAKRIKSFSEEELEDL